MQLHEISPANMSANGGAGMIQSGIFEDLQRKIDEDSAVKDVRLNPLSRSISKGSSLIRIIRS